MPSQKQPEYYHWHQLVTSGRQHGIFNLQPSLIVVCPHLNQFEGSVGVTGACFLSIPCSKKNFCHMTFDLKWQPTMTFLTLVVCETVSD